MKKIVICTLMILMAFTSNVYASSKDKTEDEMINEISMVSGMSTNEVEQVIKEKSFELSIEYEELLRNTYENYVLTATFNDGIRTRSSSQGGHKKMSEVNTSSKKGDYFYTPSFFPSSTMGWNHGHAGLYISSSTIIDAPGPGKTVRKIATNEISVSYGAKFGRLKTANTSAVTKAVSFVEKKEELKAPYNASIDNKMCDKKSFNCSQLVYCAYKESSIYLNNGQPMFVSPIDLMKDSKTNVYRTYNK
ncbi:MAG: hypothetical protein VB122_00945 [Erysipelotrichales bacterium]|nr:hypothetical protein [Erysipelotrichales bacterium]